MAHDHDHPHTTGTGFRIFLAATITLVFVIFEAGAGLLANSLALLTDAAHNLTDVLALALSFYAHRLARRPAHAGKTFGYHRAGILAAFVNSSTLVLIAFGVFHEAWVRSSSPSVVRADMLVIVGAVAFVINVLTAWLVSHGSQNDLNLRSAFLHLLGDVFSTLGAVLAGVGMWMTGYYWLDPMVSALIGLLILWNAWAIMRETLAILLESTPADVDMSLMVRDLLQEPGVLGVHDLHVWSLSRSLKMLSAHVLVGDMPVSEAALIQRRLGALLRERHGIGHSALQLECESCAPDGLYCDLSCHASKPGAGKTELVVAPPFE